MTADSKSLIRKKFRARRLAWSENLLKDLEQKKLIEQQLAENINQCLEVYGPRKVAAYRFFQDELSIEPLLERAVPWQWGFPRVEGERLIFGLLDAKSSDNWQTSPWGILEPTSQVSPCPINEFEVVLVPGLAFDRNGHRLGSGKGFYDRALQDYRGIKIGICNMHQLLEENLEVEPHDVQMDMVVTEEFCIQSVNSTRTTSSSTNSRVQEVN